MWSCRAWVMWLEAMQGIWLAGQTWRKYQHQSGSGATFWMKWEAQDDLFTKSSLGCWAMLLVLTRVWQEEQLSHDILASSETALPRVWRLSLHWCLYVHGPSYHGTRRQLIIYLLTPDWEQLSLMFHWDFSNLHFGDSFPDFL